jgi:lysozyme family protein
MESNFAACLSHILAMEGGFSNDAVDRGGPTNWGITAATLAHYRGHPVTAEDVASIDPDEARAIYHAGYWATCRAPELPGGVDLMVFDVSVNSGPGRAVRMLQGALGIEVDGIFGPVTMRAVASSRPAELIEDLALARRRFYYGIVDGDPTQERFINGWMNRVAATLTRARVMAR